MASPAAAVAAAPPHTITAALAAHRLPPAGYAEYAGYLTMTARFLGEPPSFYPILALSPPAIRTHVGLFARMFHVAAVDMGLPGHPSPALRRAAFLAASSAFNCTYCTAHACSFGDMLRGSIPRQRLGAPAPPPDAATPVVEAFARAVVARPETSETREETLRATSTLCDALGRSKAEVVASVVAFAGALNTVMDVQGVEIEPAVEAFTAKELATGDTLWTPGAHHANSSNEPVPSPVSGGVFSNLANLAATLPAAARAMAYEAFTLYADIPSRAPAVHDWASARLGPNSARFLHAVKGRELRRAFCFGLRENYTPPPGARKAWDSSARARVLFVFARTAGSLALADAAVELARRSAGEGAEISVDETRAELEAFAAADDQHAGDAALVAARRLAVAEATSLDNISPVLVEEVTSACTPEAIMELASLLSFAEMWRRMLLVFMLSSFE